MKYSITVDIEEGGEELEHDGFDLRQRELDLLAVEQACEVVLTEVTHKINASFIPVVRSGCSEMRRGRGLK